MKINLLMDNEEREPVAVTTLPIDEALRAYLMERGWWETEFYCDGRVSMTGREYWEARKWEEDDSFVMHEVPALELPGERSLVAVVTVREHQQMWMNKIARIIRWCMTTLFGDDAWCVVGAYGNALAMYQLGHGEQAEKAYAKAKEYLRVKLKAGEYTRTWKNRHDTVEP